MNSAPGADLKKKKKEEKTHKRELKNMDSNSI